MNWGSKNKDFHKPTYEFIDMQRFELLIKRLAIQQIELAHYFIY